MNDSNWIPVAPSHAIGAAANIVAAFADGEELALWRSVAGDVQAWENRCPHRGTRFTLGRILDGRLSCAYHGWEFEADSGRCAAIPAHPDMPPPKNVRAGTFRAVETAGMVWVARRTAPAESRLDTGPSDEAGAARFCRTLSVRANAARVSETLRASAFSGSAPYTWLGKLAGQPITVYLNPVGPGLTMLHVWAPADVAEVNFNHILTALKTLRASIEAFSG